MLSERQQFCLRAIGVRSWHERTAPLADRAGDSDGANAEPPSEAPWTELQQDAAPIPATVEVAAQVAPIPAQNSDTAESSADDNQPVFVPVDTSALEDWDQVHTAIEACQACELSQNCTRKVPGVGHRQADLMIIGEGPGHDEDLRGEPFVGRSGQLLDRMLNAIGFSRDQVYITNIVKCRPPGNRDPKVEEAEKCRAYLEAQIRLIKPKVILSAGRVSAHNLLNCQDPVGKLIKQMHTLPGTDIPLKVTYHPAYLLRNPSAKSIAWQDMKLLHRLLK